MKERIFTTKEQGRVLVETGLPISTASGHRSCGVDRLYSMEDNAGRVSLAEVVTPDVSNEDCSRHLPAILLTPISTLHLTSLENRQKKPSM